MKAVCVDTSKAHPSGAILKDHPLPVPQEGEALIRINRTGICNTDLEILKGKLLLKKMLKHFNTRIVILLFFVSMFVSWFVLLFVCMFVCLLFFCLFVQKFFDCLCDCLFVCLFALSLVDRVVCLFDYLLNISQFIYLFVYLVTKVTWALLVLLDMSLLAW